MRTTVVLENNLVSVAEGSPVCRKKRHYFA